MRCVWILLVVTACPDSHPCPDPGGFRLTAPDGFAQLVPGATVTIAWQADGDPGADVELRAIATDGVGEAALPPALLSDGAVTWDGRDAAGAAVPPSNYWIGGRVGQIGPCEGLAIQPDDLHLVVVQGVRLPTAAVTFAGSQLDKHLDVTTVTRSQVMLTLALDDAATAGDDYPIAMATIPGEFTPIARRYPFSGMTTTGAAIPAGTYRLVATFGAARTVGPVVTWDPAR